MLAQLLASKLTSLTMQTVALQTLRLSRLLLTVLRFVTFHKQPRPALVAFSTLTTAIRPSLSPRQLALLLVMRSRLMALKLFTTSRSVRLANSRRSASLKLSTALRWLSALRLSVQTPRQLMLNFSIRTLTLQRPRQLQASTS